MFCVVCGDEHCSIFDTRSRINFGIALLTSTVIQHPIHEAKSNLNAAINQLILIQPGLK